MKSSRIKIVSAIFVILGIFYLSSISSAEMEVGVADSDINVETIPENPEPYEGVTINLTSYSTDLNKAFIEWRNGSNTVLSGYGRTNYAFKALGPNTDMVFTVLIIPAGATNKITKKITISPSEIEVMWEAVDSYTPPFYRGKSFPSREGIIKAVALPNTSTIKSGKGKVVYTWKKDNDVLPDASGYGKDSYIFKNDALSTSENITVSASSLDGDYNATKQISIPIIDPQVIFYKKSPTEGVLYNEGFTNTAYVSEEEVTMVAEPYFLAFKGNEGAFTYSWKINGDSIATPSRKTELTVHPSSRGGYATIEIVLENLDTLYQKAVGKLRLNL